MKWAIAILALLSSLALAGVAAWFSIIGLMAVFAGLPTYAFAMAACIEVSKLVAASWLKINWDNTQKLFRSVLVVLVLVAMFVTSVGIYGLLSKAHIEQGAPVINNAAQIERLEQRIEREQREINEATRIVEQLQETVDTLIDYDKISGPDGARAVREAQEEERQAQAMRINAAEDAIDDLLDQQAQLGAELRAYEVEVGPIKYLAALFTDEPTTTDLERAVRYLILLLIFIFDPFAVLLLIAANQSLIDLTTKRKNQKEEDTDEMPRFEPVPDPTQEPKTDSGRWNWYTEDESGLSEEEIDTFSEDIDEISTASLPEKLESKSSITKKEQKRKPGMQVRPIKKDKE